MSWEQRIEETNERNSAKSRSLWRRVGREADWTFNKPIKDDVDALQFALSVKSLAYWV